MNDKNKTIKYLTEEVEKLRARVKELERSDIELKKTEEALHSSEAEYRDLYDNSPDMYVSVDLHTSRIIRCNQTLSTTLGYTKEEIIGQRVFRICNPDCLKDTTKVFKIIVETGEVHNAELQLKRRDGRKLDVILNASTVRDERGNVLYCRSALRDITERKKSEEEIIKFSRAVAQSPVSVMITDTKGDIEYINPKCENLTGYTLDEVKGQNPRILNAGVSTKVDYKELWDLITNGKEWRGEFHNRKKNGELFWEFASISPILDRTGKITHYLAVKEDITERKKIEKELRDHEEHLEKMVDDRTLELQMINTKLDHELVEHKRTAEELAMTNTKLKAAQDRIINSEKLATIGKLAGVMGHEIRNPLGIIRNSIYYLNMILKKSKQEKVKKHLDILQIEINNADKIISDVLGFARIKAPTLAEHDINNLIKKTVATTPDIPRSIKVKTDFGKELPKVFVDDTQMKLVFSNMIINAVQSMPNGGELKIATNQVNGSCVVAFRDLGCGISEENLNNVFEPLFTTKAKGIGLGLTGCKSIVENHKGRIEIQSEVNKGTTFMVKLPVFKK